MQEPLPEKLGPLILLDESLSPAVAKALSSVNYNARAVEEQFPKGTIDPTLFKWLGLQRGIWVTADEKARYRHSQEIKDAGIHIVRVQRPRKEGMSRKDQLLLLLWILDPILTEIAKSRGRTEFKAYYSGKRPKWERL